MVVHGWDVAHAVSAPWPIAIDVALDSVDEFLTYSVVSNSNPGLVTPTLKNEWLTLAYTPFTTGTATITIQATDTFGATVQQTFTVTVNPKSANPTSASASVTNGCE